MSRLICESCNGGYPTTLPECWWCRTPSHFAHTIHTSACVDTECYPNYWLCSFTTGEEFQMFPGFDLDREGLQRALSRYRIVTFNGEHYDMPIIALALAGYDNAALKAASDAIIVEQLRPWQLLDRYGVRGLDWVDHVDLFNVAPGDGSLKMYGGKMHSRKLQDLPIEPSALIDWPQRVVLREYCRNDLTTTQDLLDTFPTQLALRDQMSAEYNVDVRSKSDAQIAEAVMKSLVPFTIERPNIAPGTTFYYRPPEWLQFKRLTVLELLARSPFVVNDKGTIDMTAELERTVIRIGNSAYHMGSGGLHSTESQIVHVADNDYELSDHDVASYYPSLILRTGIFPPQIGQLFQEIYRQWYDRRLAAKRAGDKKNANTLKTLLNGTVGKLGSKWSIFYAPSELIQVTITGQLALLMLIEMLEDSGINVVSANTDGIVIRCHRSLLGMRDAIIKQWETATGFETEVVKYRMLASRDVNNYVAIKDDGEVKLKGAYAPPEPGASGWPNPTGQVCVDAVVAHLTHRIPLEWTIRACVDVRRFVHVRNVRGGGLVSWDGSYSLKATRAEMAAALDRFGYAYDKDSLKETYLQVVPVLNGNTEYLGKAVRWYYAEDSTATIVYKTNGNKVPRTDGCRPLMELPDQLPDDIDYEWYENEARSLLVDLGVLTG